MMARSGSSSSSSSRGRRRALLATLAAVLAVAPGLLPGARAQYVDDPSVLPAGQGPLYTSVSQIFAAMERWAAASPRYLSVYRAQDPVTNQSFPVARFTDHSLPRPAGQPPRRRLLLTCAVHARELIVSEVCLHVLRLLAGTPADRAPVVAWRETKAALLRSGVLDRLRSPTGPPGSDPVEQFAASFSQRYELHVAPLVNIDGRRLIEDAGKYDQRKTVPDQVDINRNFYQSWSPAAGSPSSQTYPGPFPASQWETRAMVALLTKVRPQAYADVHSGINAFLTPLSGTCSQLDVDPAHLPPLQAAADRAVRAVGNFTNGPAAALLYTALGTATDYAYGGLAIGSSVCVEVYGTAMSGSGLGVVCPRLSEWWQKCRLPASADDAATGCANECGSDPKMVCRKPMGLPVIPVSAAAAGEGKAGAAAAGGGAEGRGPARARAQLAAAARRRGASPELARWQAAVAEATAEDVGLFVPDGELVWFELEKEREAEGRALGIDGGDGGGGGGGGGGEPVPPNLRHLSGDALDAAMTRRSQLRAKLWGDLERLVGGGGGQQQNGAADVSSPSSPSSSGGSGGGAAAAAATALPEWYWRDPYLRHWGGGPDGSPANVHRTIMANFNPTDPGVYRRVVSDFAAALLAYGAAASGGALAAG